MGLECRAILNKYLIFNAYHVFPKQLLLCLIFLTSVCLGVIAPAEKREGRERDAVAGLSHTASGGSWCVRAGGLAPSPRL